MTLLAVCECCTHECCAASTIELNSALLTIVESVEVSARRAGTLASVRVAEGSLVVTGQQIAQIDVAEAKLTLEHVKLEVQVAKQQAEDDVNIRLAHKANALASTDLRRAESVNQQAPNSVPAREIDKLRLSMENTALEIERAQRDQALAELSYQLKLVALKMAEHDLAMHKIESSATGMVVQLNKHVGETVEPGELIAKIVRVDRLRAEGYVEAKDATLGLMGRLAILEIQVPGRKLAKLEGKIVFVSPEANPVNAQVRIWAEFKRGKLPIRPGLRGQVIIPVD